MTNREEARQEAERRYPALNPDAEELTYPRSAIRRMTRGAFEAGAVWASEQAEAIDRMGPAAGCAYCVGAGGYEDYDGEWRECSCQRADRGCGHPNHGAEDHDCAPFFSDRVRDQNAAEPVAYALYEKTGKRRGEWVLFTHAVSARDRSVYDVRPLYAHPETPEPTVEPEPSEAEELARLRLERLEAVEDFITRHYLDTQMGERVLAIVNGIEEVRRGD